MGTIFPSTHPLRGFSVIPAGQKCQSFIENIYTCKTYIYGFVWIFIFIISKVHFFFISGSQSLVPQTVVDSRLLINGIRTKKMKTQALHLRRAERNKHL